MMVLHKTSDQYLATCKVSTQSINMVKRYRLTKTLTNQRTNGPVNAHLRFIMAFNPSAGADEALGPFSFFRIINILSIPQFPAGFFLQMTF